MTCDWTFRESEIPLPVAIAIWLQLAVVNLYLIEWLSNQLIPEILIYITVGCISVPFTYNYYCSFKLSDDHTITPSELFSNNMPTSLHVNTAAWPTRTEQGHPTKAKIGPQANAYGSTYPFSFILVTDTAEDPISSSGSSLPAASHIQVGARTAKVTCPIIAQRGLQSRSGQAGIVTVLMAVHPLSKLRSGLSSSVTHAVYFFKLTSNFEEHIHRNTVKKCVDLFTEITKDKDNFANCVSMIYWHIQWVGRNIMGRLNNLHLDLVRRHVHWEDARSCFTARPLSSMNIKVAIYVP